MNANPVRFVFLKSPVAAGLLAQVMALYKAEGWFDRGDTAASYRRIIKGSHCFAVAMLDGRVVGMARAISDGVSDAYIQDVTVAKEFRRRGMAAGLVKLITDRLSADGIGWVALIAANGSGPLYRKRGFRVMKSAVPMKFGRS